MAGYQSIFGGNSPNAIPNSGGKANPFAGNFTPGKYAAVNAQTAVKNGGVPAAGDVPNLVTALNKIQSYNPDDQTRILNRAAQAGIVDRGKAADIIRNSAIAQPVAPPKLNAVDKVATFLHSAANPVNIAKGIVNTPKPLIRGLAYGLTGGKLLDAQNKSADVSLQNTLNAVKAFKAGQISQQRLQQITQAGSHDTTNNAADVMDATNQRKVIGSGVNTLGLIGLPGVEGALSKVGAGYRVAANTAIGTGFGVSNAAQGDNFTRGEITKQGLVGGLTAGFGSALSEGLDTLRAKQAFASKVASNNADVASVTADSGKLDELAGKKPVGLSEAYQQKADATLTKNYESEVAQAAGNKPAIAAIDQKYSALQQQLDAKTGRTMGAEAEPVAEQNFAVGSKTPYTQEVEDTLNKVKTANQTTSNITGSAGELKNLFTPGGGVEGKKIANDLRATTGNNALVKNQATIAAKDDVNFFKKFSSGENANFIQKIESGVKQDTPELQAQADKIRTAQEADYELGKSIKPGLVHVDNYFPRAGFWNNSDAQVQSFLDKFRHPTLGGKPTALESRSFPTVYDGIKAGLVPKEANPAIIALNSRTELLRAKAAQDFFEEQVGKGHDPTLVNEYIDRVMGKGLSGSSLGNSFRTVKDATYALNNLQLGFSGFHVASTGINATVSQFANGLQDLVHGNVLKGIGTIAKSPTAPLDYLFKGNKILKDYKAGNVTQDISNIAEGGGRIGNQVDYNTSGLAKSLEQLKSGSAIEAGKGIAAAPFRAFSTAAKPVMEYWVPRIKAGATKELIDRKLGELGPNASQDAIRAAKADAIDSIDNRFGQLVKDNLLWKKTVKDFAGLATRSPGWNIGTGRELGGGITDLLTKTARGKGFSERSAYTASLAATTMGIGTALSYMFTGKAPKSPIDYFYPKTGQTDKNGNAERVALPTYAKDIFSFVHNPGQTLSNKGNPLLATANEVRSNKDYFGNMVRNPADSKLTQAKQTLQFAGKNALPFTLTNANQRVDKGAGTKAQSFFGLSPAPGYITKSPFEQKVEGALNTALGSKPLTPEQQSLVNSKSAAKTQAQTGNNSGIQALVKSGQLTTKQGKDLQAASQQTSLANQFSYLLSVDRPAAARLISSASPQDLQKLGDLNKLKNSLNKTQYNKTAKPATKAASKTLLQVLNSKR